MLFAALNPLLADLENLRVNVSMQEQLRKLVADAETTGGGGTDPLAQRLVAAASKSPDPLAWRVYDHSATVMRLYALFERFAYRDLLEPWLGFLVAQYPTYSDLPPRVKTAHREGVSRLLLRAGKGRFQGLSELSVVSGYYSGVAQKQPYDLLRETFLFTDSNLRAAIVSQFLNKIGAENGWDWVCKSDRMRDFVEQTLSGEDTVEKMLDKFVDYRNDAAHGDATEVLGSGELAKYVGFIECVCRSLAECLSWRAVQAQLNSGQAHSVGIVTERFGNGANVAIMEQCRMAVGDEFFAMRDTSCHPVRVEGLQKLGSPVEHIDCDPGLELGIKFDTPLAKNAQLVRRGGRVSPTSVSPALLGNEG